MRNGQKAPAIKTQSPEAVSASMERAGYSVLAQVRVSESNWDLAYAATTFDRLIVRYSIRSVASDYHALATMLAEGPFDRAILVYSDKENSVLSDEIETWHIDDIGHLVARLAAEVAA